MEFGEFAKIIKQMSKELKDDVELKSIEFTENGGIEVFLEKDGIEGKALVLPAEDVTNTTLDDLGGCMNVCRSNRCCKF